MRQSAPAPVYDPPGHEGLAHFVSRTIDRGTDRHSADELAEELDDRGVTLSTSVTRHILSLACTCLVEDMEDVLALLADVVMRPVISRRRGRRRRGEIITLIRQDEDNPAAVAVEALMAMLYGETHPYGRRMRGTVESVERIDAGRASAISCRTLRADGAVAGHGGRHRAGTRDRGRALRVWGMDGSGAVRGDRCGADASAGRPAVPRRPDDEQVADRHRLRVHDHRAPGPRPITRIG